MGVGGHRVEKKSPFTARVRFGLLALAGERYRYVRAIIRKAAYSCTGLSR